MTKDDNAEEEEEEEDDVNDQLYVDNIEYDEDL